MNKNSPATLIADGEYCCDHVKIIELAKKGAIDCLIMDPESYGFTGWRKLIKECEGSKIQCSPHCWGTSVKTFSIGHLAAAFSQICPTIEGAPDTIEGVDFSGYEIKNGILNISDKSGFGMELEYFSPVDIYRPY